MNYEIYENIMSDTPVIDDGYLRSVLDLSENQTITFVEITEVKESNTALVIKASVQIKDGDDVCQKKLFIKTMKQNKAENVYHGVSQNEGKFYKFIRDSGVNNLPIPVCYDVFISEEKGEFVIVLEDISSRYTAPDDAILKDKSIWFSCAESLARFHAAFWNREIIPQIEETERDFQEDRDGIQEFISEFSEKFDDKTKEVLRRSSEINISLSKGFPHRINGRNNVTIGNGDSHIYNFMLPLGKENKPLIVDFQFWGEGTGTNDLSHLTRVGFSDDLKREIQRSLVEHYHKTLLANGVTGYSWDECWRDYRLNAVTKVLIPFYQYAGFKIKYDEWIGDLQGLVYNYEYLNGDELYRELI
ncbi:MAG: ecdysteroid 22-kinase family protein [Oscillospiraceae bacterium]|nr:ecdysteroid 22-kinase family protein [Oscillospiraceae bacterium]